MLTGGVFTKNQALESTAESCATCTFSFHSFSMKIDLHMFLWRTGHFLPPEGKVLKWPAKTLSINVSKREQTWANVNKPHRVSIWLPRDVSGPPWLHGDVPRPKEVVGKLPWKGHAVNKILLGQVLKYNYDLHRHIIYQNDPMTKPGFMVMVPDLFRWRRQHQARRRFPSHPPEPHRHLKMILCPNTIY